MCIKSYRTDQKTESGQQVVPTREMIEAGSDVIQETREYLDSYGMAEAVYIAMQARQPRALR